MTIAKINQRWIAYEKNAEVAIAEVKKETEKSFCLVNSGKVPRRRVWLDGLPPPDDALHDNIAAAAAQISAPQLWRDMEAQTLSLAELAACSTTAAARRDNAQLQQLAVLQVVLQNPIYFYRSNHTICPVEADTVQRALDSLNRRRQEQQLEQQLLQQLENGEIPAAIEENMSLLIHQQQKNGAPYRALKQYLKGDGLKFAHFFIRNRLLTGELDYWRRDFEQRWPQAINVEAAVTAPPALPYMEAPVFSIDDEGTVEIDDAFSVQPAAADSWRVGIHIAAPALMLSAQSDAAARHRQVSVYFPNKKYCMLPANAVAACSLSADEYRPALSLYVYINSAQKHWRVGETAVEMVRLSCAVTPAQADARDFPARIVPLYEKLLTLAQTLPAPDTAAKNKGYYKINPQRQQVVFRPRQGAVRLVEILMRTANHSWAQQIAAANCGGLFRTNSALKRTPPPQSPYMWLTSPLRRYVDLANQRVLLHLINQAPPVTENWEQLRKSFEARYALAQRYQGIMENHWALSILRQNKSPEDILSATYLGKNRAQLDEYPLVGLLPPAQEAIAAHSKISVMIQDINLLQQSLSLSLATAANG